jgi:hypothetical protein
VKPARDRRALTIQIAIGLVLGTASGAAAAFLSTTSNTGDTLVASPDLQAPAVARSVVMLASGTIPGSVRQGSQYRVYAQITDAGNPASGVASATADVTALTTGSAAISLTAGAYTAGALTYNYRSALLTADNPLAAGAKTYTISASDAASPVNSMTSSPWPVTVDNTAPAAADVQTSNGGTTPGKAETGDTITFTFSEQIDPGSVLAGWTGAATTVRVRLTNAGCAPNDAISILDSTGASVLPLGTTCLGRTGYVSATRTFTGSTMVQSGAVITITLGAPSGTTGTETVAGAMVWTPTATLVDAAGNACSTAAATESGALDLEF